MLITKNEIRDIEGRQNSHCVSIYIKTHRAGQSQADRIRWKNACSEAADKLISAGLDGERVRKIMAPANKLLNEEDFWLHLSDGLCMFLSEDYSEQVILPVNFENRVWIEDRFITSPLYLYFNNRQRFFIYDISLGHNRFFEVNKDSITPVIIEDLVPSSISEIPQLDDKQENLQQHGKDLFHGHGSGKDSAEKRLHKYIQALSDGMHEIFVGENIPMVLSGPEEIVSTFRKVNSYKPIVDSYVSGNNRSMDPVELHERAWHCLERWMSENSSIIPGGLENDELRSKLITNDEALRKSIKQKNVSKLVLNENFQSAEDAVFKDLDSIIRSASSCGAEIDFASEHQMNKFEKDIIGFKYY